MNKLKEYHKKALALTVVLAFMLSYVVKENPAFSRQTGTEPGGGGSECRIDKNDYTYYIIKSSKEASCSYCAVTGAGVEVKDINGKVIAMKYSRSKYTVNATVTDCVYKEGDANAKCTQIGLIGGTSGMCDDIVVPVSGTGSGTGTGS